MAIIYVYAETKKSDDYKAKGQYDTCRNKLTIFKGSIWNKVISQVYINDNGKAVETRKKLESEGYVNSNGEFIKDYEVGTLGKKTPLSPAAEIITGRSTTGTDFWLIKENDQRLGDYLKENNIIDSRCYFISSKDSKTIINITPYLHQNIIFYGVPGCGKSYFIKNLLNDGTYTISNKFYKRVLFHPEYSYSDFVGQIMPVTNKNSISYEFKAGPFVEILKSAYLDPANQYILIIEEINRGNAPAIFGDLFQLLDRSTNGISEYGIYNKEIINYIIADNAKTNQLSSVQNLPIQDDAQIDNESLTLNGKDDFENMKDEENELCEDDDCDEASEMTICINKDELKIPSNLTILATMNTCDQNVFTMDTAFKRRWRMVRIKNNFDDKDFANSTLAKQKIVYDITWAELGKAINDAIVKNCNDGSSAEDKQLGTYFVKENECQTQIFAEKVMLYLWDDVVKYEKSQLFNTAEYPTLDAVIDGFISGKNVFASNCVELQRLYALHANTQSNENNQEDSLSKADNQEDIDNE